jgi:hypothetical protein
LGCGSQALCSGKINSQLLLNIRALPVMDGLFYCPSINPYA